MFQQKYKNEYIFLNYSVIFFTSYDKYVFSVLKQHVTCHYAHGSICNTLMLQIGVNFILVIINDSFILFMGEGLMVMLY